MRLIDADEFTQEMKKRQTAVSASVEHPITDRYFTDKEHWEGVLLAFVEAKLTMDNIPTVDAAPVKHGRWEEPEPEGAMLWDKRVYSQCSVCKKKSYLGRVDKYCRYCGAKMDLEEQDAQTEQSGK